ncbi:hypothetical protein V6N13_065649 [Hibiscus sabdariffa]
MVKANHQNNRKAKRKAVDYEEVGEHENNATAKEVNETVAHNATSNVVEADETIGEELSELEDEANDTVEKDANEVAHDAALETNPNEAAVEKGWVEVEDVVEEYAYSNEVGGGNTVAGDTEPEMVEERESEMNEDKEDVDSGFVDSDVGEDEGIDANENEADVEGSNSFHNVHGPDSDGPTWPEFNTVCDMENPKFEIKTFNDMHTYVKVMKNPNITSKFIAKTYLHKFQTDRNYAPSSLKVDVEADYMVILYGTKCLRARKLALEMIDGSYKDQFKKLYAYLGEIRETNPGTTTIFQIDYRLFERVSICPGACKNGYKTMCRPITSLDGCFLKSPYIGWLLAVVGIDANNGIYPIAYVVENENFSAWY